MTRRLIYSACPLVLGLAIFLGLVFVGELSEIDFRECLNRADGSSPSGLRPGEPGWTALLTEALSRTAIAATDNWPIPLLMTLWIWPSAIIVFVKPNPRTVRVQCGLLLLVGLLLLALSLPPAANHTCDRNGVGLHLVLLSVFAVFVTLPLAAIGYVLKRTRQT